MFVYNLWRTPVAVVIVNELYNNTTQTERIE